MQEAVLLLLIESIDLDLTHTGPFIRVWCVFNGKLLVGGFLWSQIYKPNGANVVEFTLKGPLLGSIHLF